jgi:enoyl-CoA hydratase/carnithine racemase
MTLTTKPVSASEACAIHLVDELTDHLEESLRKLTLRLNLLDDNTIVDMKRYFQKMGGITLELEQAATTEIARLVAQPHVQQNIANYVTQGAFPWERKV